jgi:hypothetical protein
VVNLLSLISFGKFTRNEEDEEKIGFESELANLGACDFDEDDDALLNAVELGMIEIQIILLQGLQSFANSLVCPFFL